MASPTETDSRRTIHYCCWSKGNRLVLLSNIESTNLSLSPLPVTYCPWLEYLGIEYGPRLSSSNVTEIISGGELTNLTSLLLLFTPISPKALHKLCSEYSRTLVIQSVNIALLASCKKLKRATLHISFDSFFPLSSADSVLLNKYHTIVSSFQVCITN